MVRVLVLGSGAARQQVAEAGVEAVVETLVMLPGRTRLLQPEHLARHVRRSMFDVGNGDTMLSSFTEEKFGFSKKI